MKASMKQVLVCWAAIFLGIVVLAGVADRYGWLSALVASVGVTACAIVYSGVVRLLSRRPPK